ncbi:unnamed protein product [marine sediment metagenome]|uniref:Uncharacterized protein n=1 Tax=marine sediment metagenome TaxID=412755 RepID=X1C7H1_9ZZZZ
MAIDIQTERTVTFKEAARYLPGHPAISTLHRWRNRGIKGVKLETIRIGGVRYSSRQALQRFFNATTVAADSRGGHSLDLRNHPLSRNEDRRQRIASDILDEAGI